MKLINRLVDFFGGLAVVLAFDEDPELWDAPRKRERIRRRWRKKEGA